MNANNLETLERQKGTGKKATIQSNKQDKIKIIYKNVFLWYNIFSNYSLFLKKTPL